MDVGMRIDVASIDMVSEVNMVSGVPYAGSEAAELTQMRIARVPPSLPPFPYAPPHVLCVSTKAVVTPPGVLSSTLASHTCKHGPVASLLASYVPPHVHTHTHTHAQLRRAAPQALLGGRTGDGDGVARAERAGRRLNGT